MSSRLVFALILFAPLYAMAAGGHGEGVPWKTIGVQSFNFLFLFSLLFYLLKDTVIEHFKDRKKSYTDLVSKAEQAKKTAETSHKEIADRLHSLRESAKENSNKAQAEADALKTKLLKEADEVAQKLKADAKRTADIEVQKAKLEIQAFALTQAIQAAESKLDKEASQDDHTRLQSEFIRKIQAVSQ